MSTPHWVLDAIDQWNEAVSFGIHPHDLLPANVYKTAFTHIRERTDRLFLAMVAAFPMADRHIGGFCLRNNLTAPQFKRQFVNWVIGKHWKSIWLWIKSSRGLTILREAALMPYLRMRDDWEFQRWEEIAPSMPWLEENESEGDL